MNNFNILNKLQTVFTTAVSNIKENFSEENISAFFDFSAKTDFSIGDIEQLNNEFLQYQARIKEKIENKKTSDPFSEDKEEEKNNPFEKINKISKNNIF